MRHCKCSAPLDYAPLEVTECWECRTTRQDRMADALAKCITQTQKALVDIISVTGTISAVAVTEPTYTCLICRTENPVANRSPYVGLATRRAICMACMVRDPAAHGWRIDTRQPNDP